MRVFKKGNRNTKSLAYTSLVRPILKYGCACWDPRREGQINALYRVPKKAAQFTNHSAWETLAQHRTIASVCAFFLKHTLGNRLGNLYTTGCEGPTI